MRRPDLLVFVASASTLLLHPGCGNSEVPRSATRPILFDAPHTASVAPPFVRAPIRVTRTGGAAPWLGPIAAPGKGESFVVARASTSGFSTAVFSTNRGVFVRGGAGVTGPLPPTASGALAFAGPVGKDDGLLAVTAGGDVYFARSADAAMAGKYEARPRVEAPTGMDSADQVAAIAVNEGVFVSLDAGTSWKKLVLPRGAAVTTVHVRADGIVAALTKTSDVRKLYLSKGAKAFVPSQYQPTDIWRNGAVIRSMGSCPAALSADGSTWFAPDWKKATPTKTKTSPSEGTSARAIAEELAMLDLGPLGPDPFGADDFEIPTLGPWESVSSHGSSPAPSPVAPPAPPRPGPGRIASGQERDCGGLSMLSMLSTGNESCSGAGCVVNAQLAEPPRTNQDTLIFGDARCARAAGTTASAATASCAKDAPLTKAPTLARVDYARGTVRTLTIPQDCRLRDVVRAGAGAWILCEEKGTTKIFAIDEKDRFVAEGSVPAVIRHPRVTVAPDGTLALVDQDHRVYARDPGALGAGKWRALAADLRSPQPLGGSTLLVARVSSHQAPDLTLGVESGGSFVALAPPVAVEGAVVGLSVLADGRVQIETTKTRKPNMIIRTAEDPWRPFIVMNDGTLEPYDPKGPAAPR